jgi:hypothetical protein
MSVVRFLCKPGFEVRICDASEVLYTKFRSVPRFFFFLGWPIDPKHKRVAIYRQGKAIKMLEAPTILLGKDVLPGALS